MNIRLNYDRFFLSVISVWRKFGILTLPCERAFWARDDISTMNLKPDPDSSHHYFLQVREWMEYLRSLARSLVK